MLAGPGACFPWAVLLTLIQLRQAEEILVISFHTEHVGQHNLEYQSQKGQKLRALKLIFKLREIQPIATLGVTSCAKTPGSEVT